MTGKHTPGPWEIGKRYNSIIASHETGWDDDDNMNAYGGHMVCENVKSDANARLITAAPDLLEALKALLRFAENTESELGIILGSADSARAAIAKAEGRE